MLLEYSPTNPLLFSLISTIISSGAFHLSELTSQPIPIVMRISLKIKTNHPDQSNPKYYAQGRWFFSKPLAKSLFFIAKMSGLTMIQLASSDFWKVPLVSSLHSPHCPMVLLLILTAVAFYYHYPFFLLSPIILSPLLLLSPDTLPPTSMLYCTCDTVEFCV